MRTDDHANLYAALRAGFPAELDRIAIETDHGLHYRWHELDRASAMMANLLQSLELPAGARIAAHVDKSVEALMLYLGCLRAGFVYLPLNPAYREAELDHFLVDAEPSVVVCAPRDFRWVSKLAFRLGVQQVYTLDDDRGGTLLDRAGLQDDAQRVVPKAADELAAILYTSGTTGRSKGAMLSHGNLLANARTLQTFWDWRADDVLIHALPIFHVHGLFVAAHGALLNGSPMLWCARFEPRAVLERLPRASVFMGVPTMYVRLLRESGLTREVCAAMRLFVSGSAPLQAETFRAWQARTGHTLLERYGMSETLMLTSNPAREREGGGGGGGEGAGRVAGSVGPALPGVGLRVVEDASARPVADGEVGEVQVRGPSVFAGYWRLPSMPAEDFTSDGWFRTGDLGRLDARGYLWLAGRSKDVIISGGYNVYPAEIEGYLDELPGVAESAVVGVPHADFGEAVLALVVAEQPGVAPDEAALLAALKGRIAGYKLPKRLIVVAELPRNAMGKVQKKLLRERHREAFAAGP